MSMADVTDGFWRLPPIARTISAATLVTSVSIYAGLLPAYWLAFIPARLFTFPPQIWRVFSNFLLTRPKLSMTFDAYFLYTNTRSLEMDNPRFAKREDLIWYFIFVCSAITAVCTYLFGGGFFLPALILAICRTATQDQRGMKASIYFFTIPAQLMPFALLLMSLLMDGPFLMELCGLFVAHLYDFLTRIYPTFTGGRNLLPTPAFLSRIVQAPRDIRRSYGTAFRPPTETPSGNATGSSTGSGPLPEAWRSRGPGRRLGD
ncbi:hypothetical protein SODALDRAFT_310543 [Sodiomyces alkalinus F11]|uniref:Derlin n=1 Tax=Sodiomyces alkalinus (strain CBS 110278 / VKM F-3762 / F11) TaxID=1314773 RepID=A0A3N2PXH4_SODAK|nr:hypothetical protein SODALDRAFT_310543 [Sodiomyces alkalinus F11]ROT39211.1 hypothetical protein SODALDRAFT_310543 [Sodiomyces alkalinus F11]